MRARPFWILVLLMPLWVACARRQAPPETRKAIVVPAIDPRVLNLFRGAVVTDRSGELQLASSALHSIDGDLQTIWTTPPGDIHEDVTISLLARTRIESVGISNKILASSARAASKIAFDWSADGTQFQPLQTVTVTKLANNQLVPIKPVEAVALRATILETLGNVLIADLPELELRGTELEAPRRGSISGTWKLNQLIARLAEDGARVHGVVHMDPPMLIDGAWNDRLVRFAWVRGRQFGVGVLAVDSTSNHLNGLWWFREAIGPFFGTSWFGKRAGSALPAAAPLAVAKTSLRDRQTFPLYQIRFDAHNRLTADSRSGLDLVQELVNRQPDKQFRVVANEVHGASAEENLRRTEQQIASLREALAARGVDTSRITFSPVGSRYSRHPEGMPYYVFLHSRVDLEVIENK